MVERVITIDGREIGPGKPPYIVAELSANHNGDLTRALEVLAAAKAAGADAIKVQTYTADTMTIDHDGPGFIIEDGLWSGRSLYDLYREASTPWDWHEALFNKGNELGITVFSTPFDATAVDYLETLDAPAYKIASFEVLDIPLIERVASTGKPIILSTGMATLEEISDAVAAVRKYDNELVVLHCVSAYPAPPSEANLSTIPDLAKTFDCISGLSDHTLGTSVSVAAVTLGAAMIEKHFTLRRSDGGPDSAFSLEPDELARMVDECRIAWESIGRVNYERERSEEAMAVFRRSLYVVEDVPAGAILNQRNVRAIRPGYGLPPKHLPAVLGRRATRNLLRGEPLVWDMVEHD